MAGYTLIVEEGDLRQNITVVTPKGATFARSVGRRERRSRVWTKSGMAHGETDGQTTPVALIVRYNASENAEHPDKTTFLSGGGEDHSHGNLRHRQNLARRKRKRRRSSRSRQRRKPNRV